jgi:hypothetical protein
VLVPVAFFAAQDIPKRPLTLLALQEAVQQELL